MSDWIALFQQQVSNDLVNNASTTQIALLLVRLPTCGGIKPLGQYWVGRTLPPNNLPPNMATNDLR